MEQNIQPQGKNFLKVTGILMIIAGAIAIITSLIAIAGIAFLISIGAGTPFLYVASIFMVLSSAMELVAGILGVKNCARPDKAQSCIVWGAVVAAFCVLGSILTVVGGGSFPVFSLLLGLVLPALYIIGAVENQQK